MGLDLPPIDMVEVLGYTAWVIRDFAILFALFLAFTALVTGVLSSLIKKRFEPDRRSIEGGVLAWITAVLSYLAPIESGLLLSPALAIVLLIVSTVGWAALFISAMLIERSRPR